VVLKYFGQLCLILAALTLVPLLMSVILGDTRISLRYGIVIGGLGALGGCLETRLRTGDEVVILTHSKNLGELEKRWQPKQRAGEPAGSASVTKTRQK
jgi:hypothetical protein